MQTLRNWNVLVGLLLAVAIVAIGHFVFRIPEGLGRLGLFFGAVGVGTAAFILLQPKK